MAPSSMRQLRDWVLQNKLKAVGTIWGTGLAASLAFQWTRPIPTQMKVIHARVWTQASTLAALVAVAAVSLIDEDQ